MVINMKNTKRTKCEIYSRITGYLRPIEQWNNGKRQEYNDRKVFKVTKANHRSVKKKNGG